MAQPEIPGNGVGIPRMPFGSDGSNWLALLVDALGRLQVDAEVDNFPADPATETTLASILTELGQKLETGDLSIEAVTKYLEVAVKSSVLPTGAATETTLDSIKTAVEKIDDFADVDNLIFGYKDRYVESQEATSGNGSKTVDTTPVDSDEIWVINYVVVRHDDTTSRRLHLRQYDGTTYHILEQRAAAGRYVNLIANGPFVLKEGDLMRGEAISLATGKKVYIAVSGYKMSIA